MSFYCTLLYKLILTNVILLFIASKGMYQALFNLLVFLWSNLPNKIFQVWQNRLIAFITFIPLKEQLSLSWHTDSFSTEESHCSLGHRVLKCEYSSSEILLSEKKCLPSATSTHMLLNLVLLLKIRGHKFQKEKTGG